MKYVVALLILALSAVGVTGWFFLRYVEIKPASVNRGQIWGAYTGNTEDSFKSFGEEVGREPNINAIFLDWGDAFPSYLASSHRQTLLIFWEPNEAPLSQIANGLYDNYINTFSEQALSYKSNVILVPFPEMNGNWDTWGGTYGSNTPALEVAAWQHLHDVFIKTGETNVNFGWDVNSDSVPDTPANAINKYYPGSGYVDYVGVDGFNFGDPWQSYSDIFSSAISQLKTYNKPIYIFSMASAEGSQKAAWITDALSQIKSDSGISGWVWFNENKEQNWLVDSDAAALQAFKKEIN